MSIWYSRRKKEEKSLRLAAACQGFITTRAALRTPRASRRRERSAFIAKLTEKDKKTTEKDRKEAPFGLF